MTDEFPALTAFDISYRLDLDPDLQEFVKNATAEGRAITVTADESAADIARRIDPGKIEVLQVILKDNSQPCGIVLTDWVRAQVERHLTIQTESLQEAIEVLAAGSLVPDRGHLHEWLNFERPPRQQCPGGPPGTRGSHYTYGASPCPRHR